MSLGNALPLCAKSLFYCLMASSNRLLAAPAVTSLVAATMIISTVAYVSHLNGSGNGDKNSAKGNQQQVTMSSSSGNLSISAVPEANAGLVMIPFVGAVLAFSSLHLFRAKTAKNKAI
jgi:hypothetical protein